MITVYPILCQRMVQGNVTPRELAAIAELNIVTFYLKMSGIKRWTLVETLKICCFFRTPDVEHLFSRGNCCFCTKTL